MTSRAIGMGSTKLAPPRLASRLGVCALLLVVIAHGPARGQQSASYRLEEHTVNAGGHPAGGAVLSSPSYSIRLDAIGDGVARSGAGGTSYGLDAGFVAAYRPPGEVRNLTVDADKITLRWDPESSAGSYNLYRDLLTVLSSLGYGSCQQWNLVTETAVDGAIPPSADGFFYLVTVENRLAEEGTKGFDSAGGERPNVAPCP